MRKAEIEVGATYVVKVSDRLAPVRIVSESQYGGWNGVNERTGRTVRIRSAQKCRVRVYPVMVYSERQGRDVRVWRQPEQIVADSRYRPVAS